MLGENRPILIITNDTDSVMEGQKWFGGEQIGETKMRGSNLPCTQICWPNTAPNKFNEAFRIVQQ